MVELADVVTLVVVIVVVVLSELDPVVVVDNVLVRVVRVVAGH